MILTILYRLPHYLRSYRRLRGLLSYPPLLPPAKCFDGKISFRERERILLNLFQSSSDDENVSPSLNQICIFDEKIFNFEIGKILIRRTNEELKEKVQKLVIAAAAVNVVDDDATAAA